jgi:hypothetical protein
LIGSLDYIVKYKYTVWYTHPEHMYCVQSLDQGHAQFLCFSCINCNMWSSFSCCIMGLALSSSEFIIESSKWVVRSFLSLLPYEFLLRMCIRQRYELTGILIFFLFSVSIFSPAERDYGLHWDAWRDLCLNYVYGMFKNLSDAPSFISK